MAAIRSKIVSVAPKVAASVHAQTRISNVSAKIVDRTLDDQGPVERRQDRDSYSVATARALVPWPLFIPQREAKHTAPERNRLWI